ncbi:MAG: hypothetical protein MJ202_10285 [Lentisphaeria bacterium]|nr:hypothetical protein [Lentisphaeria bacterium]
MASTPDTTQNPLKPQYDAPIWPSITPKLITYRQPDYMGPFFCGKALSAPEGTPGGAVTFRKELDLGGKAAEVAYLQYFATKGSVTATVNGTGFPGCGSAMYPECRQATDALKAGVNEVCFTVEQADAAVIGELFVRYADGTTARFSTDDGFLCSADGEKWQAVRTAEITRPLSNESVEKAYVPYRNLEEAQLRFLKGAVGRGSATAGTPVRLRFDFEGPAPRHAFPATLVIRNRQNRHVIWSEKIHFTPQDVLLTSESTWQLSADYTMPLYVYDADATLTLEASELFVLDGTTPRADFRLERVAVDPRFAEKRTAAVRRTANGPQFFLDDAPFFALWGGADRFRRLDKKYRASDMPLQGIQVETLAHTWWIGLDEYNLETFDIEAELTRRENPDAYFVINLLIYPPGAWLEKYPEEMCRQSDGQIPHLGRIAYSTSSDQAKKDMMAAMTAAIEHMENSPYGNRIIAYKINSGDTTEWLAHRFDDGTSVDFSEPAKRKFKAYAAEYYPELKDTSIPTPEERGALDDGEMMRQVDKHLKTVAFNRFYSKVNAEFMLDMCREAKRLTGNRKLIGTYYGYSFFVASDCSSQLRAHGALKEVLDADVLDFLMSPQCYSNRDFGDTCGDMKPFATMLNHNVIPIIEDDTRTHNGHGAMPGAHYYCQTITPEQTISITTRNMAIALCRNQPNLFYSLCAGYDMDFPEAVEEGKTLRTVGEYAIRNAVKRNAEVALVVSEEAFMAAPTLDKEEYFPVVQLQQLYMPDGSVMTNPQRRANVWGDSLNQNLTRVARAGAPTDYLLGEDLKDNPGDYKVYFFLNCYNYDEAFLQAVEKLRQRECTLVWLYAPGYSCNNASGEKFMERLTGFILRKQSEAMHPLFTLNDGRTFASPITPIKPFFAVDENDSATVLGRYENGTTAYAVKKTGKATSIFHGVYRLDVPVVQEILRNAGAFVYSESSDPVEANEHFVTLHARFDGQKTIHLPAKTDVLDIVNRRIVARDADSFSFEAPLHSTWFFYYGQDADKLLKELNQQ